MALQVRRGTNAERLSITPLAGELIYVTDTKQLYIGDGSTVGGTTTIAGTIDSLLADTSPQLGGNLDLNGNTIVGTGSININGTITATGNINLGDGAGNDVISLNGVISGNLLPQTDTTWNIGAPTFQFKEAWISQLNVENQINANRINGSLLADDSTVVFDAATGTLDATALVGTFTGRVVGDVTGSIFGDDSTLLIDGVNNVFTGDIRSARLTVSKPEQPGDGLNGGIGEVNIDVFSNDNRSLLNLRRRTTDDLTGNTDVIYGTVTFGRDDVNGLKTTGIIFGRENSIYFGVAPDGAFNAADKFFVWRDYKLGIGLTSPAEALDVNGNANVSGTVTAAGFVGSVFADDSATIVDGITGSVTAQSFVQFGSLTSTERNDLTAANGMVIYNTTNNKFEGYQNSVWINLDDGSPAS
jgi:hypothetical protein